MGVPKFFRYISERYPCLSEVVKEYQIPEFDNLYLDMNGIIHMCSHPDDNNPHFRITEEKIFKDVFHYIEVLFRMIHPQKLFFMAIDGVAPRAKMNQQRGRRFRSAKDAEKQEAEAAKKGETLPDVARFDSNCITPGTVFMAKLHEQLKYFVVDKISNDPSWQKCKVILSGHETPGEGEHKIMDYIRYTRAQPGYDPNTRHCLYGLDADLIMLGLCTHEPHFSLLREEVKFGKKSTKRLSVPEEITFFLLHLSLMREYLELEFEPLKDKLKGYEYDFEKIIDDWVLMGFLVGNDFIPHLPNLHIANGALPILYKAYMDILPTLDGYINEAGTLNLSRFEKFMEKLGDIDLENFEEIRDDLLYMEDKTGRKWNAHTKVSTRPLEEWVSEDGSKVPLESLEPEKPIDSGLAALIKETDDMYLNSADDTEEQSDEDDAFENYKKDYYRNKLEYKNVTREVMRDQAEGYVRAIQWNLNYYYNGCCSWSWYYPHHYAPYISDIKGFSNLKIEFDLGTPFLPYEQLLAVLPSASKTLLPTCYHYLMTDENSPIKSYYPEDFQTDLNGKRQEWEAVVLVPFIDENILLEAMRACNDMLTPEEKKRNSHGPMLIYSYTPTDNGPYYAPEYFNTIPQNHTEIVMKFYDEIRVPIEKLIKGAYPGVKMNTYYPGFPTMKHLKYKAHLQKAKLKIFESPSRNENMIITIIPDKKFSDDKIPVDLLGTTVYVNWPHLVEAKVMAISNSKRKYISMGGPNQYNTEERSGVLVTQFQQEIEGSTEFYKKRMGIECGEVKVLVYVQVMIGRRYIFSSNGRLTLEKEFTQNISYYPIQTIVYNISVYDSHHTLFRDIESVFHPGCSCFTLTNPYYGSQGVVQDSKESLKKGRIKISISVLEEPDFISVKQVRERMNLEYKPLYHAACQLSISTYLFSRLTGSIFITARNNEGGLKNVNIGLDLKFNKKNKETPGYTRKVGNTWYYTNKAADLVRLYSEKFPEVLVYLCQDEKGDDINIEKMFPENYDEKLKELQSFLKSLPVNGIEKQTCGSCALETEVIEELERTIDIYVNNSKKECKKVTMHVKPGFLYRPELQCGALMPDPKTQTQILDRVVNVRMGFTVPLGLKGTITAIYESTTGSDRDVLYDVIFDKTFKDGMALNCSENRGYKLPNTAFINISYGQRLLVEKTGKPDELIAGAEASTQNVSNSFNNGYYMKPKRSYNSTLEENQRRQQSEQWLPPQLQSHYKSFQNQQTFQKENSAFAQFTSGGIVTDQSPYQSYHSNKAGPQNLYNTSSNSVAYNAKSNYNQQSSYNQQSNYNQQSSRNRQSNYNQQSKYNEQSKYENNSNEFGNVGTSNYQKFDNQQDKGNKSQRPNDNSGPSSSRKIINKKEQNEDTTNKMNKHVNTDFLKSVLGIRSNNETDKNISNKNTASKTDISGNNVSFDILAQAANAPASVRLLTYYQSNGLGLPRYQYFNFEKLIQCQVTLPSGELVVGKAARTREEASENVASEVLEIFMKKATERESTSQRKEDFPSPPKTWVQPTTSNSQDKNYSVNASSSKIDSAVLNNPFVPLQAIKNHKIKTSNINKGDKNSTKENVTKQQNSRQESQSSIQYAHQEQGATVRSQNKSKKERKTRIAANFVKK